jgi:hypothetical protein
VLVHSSPEVQATPSACLGWHSPPVSHHAVEAHSALAECGSGVHPDYAHLRMKVASVALQRGRGAAKQQETGRLARSVSQNPDPPQKIGHELHLIDHDQATFVAERELGLGEQGDVGTPLCIDEARGGERPGDLASERGLADLPCPEQDDHGMLAQQPADASHMSFRSTSHS